MAMLTYKATLVGRGCCLLDATLCTAYKEGHCCCTHDNSDSFMTGPRAGHRSSQVTSPEARYELPI